MTTLNLRAMFIGPTEPESPFPPGAKPMPYLLCTLIFGVASLLLSQYSSAEVLAIISAIVGGMTAILGGGAAALVKIIYAIKSIPAQTRKQMDQSAMPTTEHELTALEDRIVSKTIAALDAREKSKTAEQPKVQT